ncbi:hypothetical protein A3717_37600 [Alcanivorax sp. HI0013]|nr:hypothetical protein A3717_37600 [Alcanivorax sp. HI0013]
MTQKIEFLCDVGSPTAYLAWSQLPALCERTGAELVYVPVLLGGIFKATGNNPPGAGAFAQGGQLAPGQVGSGAAHVEEEFDFLGHGFGPFNGFCRSGTLCALRVGGAMIQLRGTSFESRKPENTAL